MTVHAEGDGSIALGGDAIDSIFVTGGVNQFFVGRYERLAEAYLSPRALYRELRLEEFTGRAWLVRAVDDFLAANERGYLLIEAEAGMGKTAFMAWIARERGYVHHFVRLMPDADDVGLALRNLSAQLIRAWDLGAMAAGGVLPANASRPDFFADVLYEAADRRDATRPGEPIVLVVDGLNETAALPFQNPLALPSELPSGVYVLATQRTTHIPLVLEAPRRVLRIRPRSPDNLADVRAYLERRVGAPDLAARVAASGATHAEVVDRLTAWSGGVWLVLRYVLAELRTGARTPREVSSLPVGLWQYYARFWRDWQRSHETTWPTVDLPLLVTLTAAQEPLALDLLCELSRCPEPGRAAELVGDAWRPFLQIVEDGTRERYAAFHDSLGEFTAGLVDASALSSAERFFVGRLSGAQREAHLRIAGRYLAAWGDLDQGLPSLRGDAASMDDGYGLRHLVHHLVQASQDAVLHGLMELEWPRGDTDEVASVSPAANAWYEAHRTRREFAGYALDVQRAWSRAEQVPYGPGAPRAVALELRYALIEASVNSVAGNVPSALLLLLADHGMVTTAQALELARETPDARTRAEALSTLLPRLAGEVRARAAREAMAAVQLVPDGYWRAGELFRLAVAAGGDHLGDLRRVADAMRKPYERDISQRGLEVIARFGALVPAPPRETSHTFDPVDPAEFAEQYLQRTRHGVATLLLGLPGAGTGAEAGADPGEGAGRRVAASRFVRAPRWRAELLTEAARTAPDGSLEDLLRAALDISLQVGDRDILNATLRSVAVHLAETGAADTAVACAERIPDAAWLASALFGVAGRSDESTAPGVAGRALAVTAGIDDAVTRGRLLRDNAAHLAPMAADGSLAPVLAALPGDWHAAVLGALAGHADPEDRMRLHAEALEAAVACSGDGGARVVADLVAAAPPGLLPAARRAVAAVADTEQRAGAAAALAARLGGLGLADEAGEVTGTIHDPYWAMRAAFGVAAALAGGGQAERALRIAARLPAGHWRAEVLALAGRRDAAFAVADATPDPRERIAVLLRIATAARPHGYRHGDEQGAPGGAGDGAGDGARDGDHGSGDAGRRDAVTEARAVLAEITDPADLAQATLAVALAQATGGRAAEAVALVRTLPDVDRAIALTRLTPHLGDAVADALPVARELRDPVSRGRVLAGLTGPLVASGTLDAQDVQEHVRTVLRLLATGTRADLLEAMPALMPALVELAGPQGPADLAAAVTAAYRWWP
ncbi:hypothetical protein JOL79_24045 [Microbispora sp. RL4-1S]|uniref:Uncharacterized protein n=1 Tax=Microbispora oryzae TaxID=2806554 RepID=A0A940WTU0_9ACTN|nr:hypothetical protein [Microbispora oryzae]MBP2706884.1 hypothetical protein [Microbispora oryzae]